jgi:2'-5' RNA ligase
VEALMWPDADATEDHGEPTRVCFLAVEVPRPVGEEIAAWVLPLLDPPARAVKPDRFHLTLVYYGAVAAGEVDALTAEIAVHAHGAPLGLEPASPGRFGKGHVLWVGVGGDVTRLAALRAALLAATSRFGAASAGLADSPESEFVPHVTVARVRGRPRSPRRFLEARPEWDASLRFVADRLTLFESAGGRYRVLAEFPLDREPCPDGEPDPG